MFGGVDKVDAFDVSPRHIWCEGFVASAFRRGIEVIHQQSNLVTVYVSSIKEMGNFKGPIRLRPLLAESRRMARQT